MADEWHAREPKKISAQEFYKAALTFFEKNDINSNQTISGSEFLKYIQEQNKKSENIEKLLKSINSNSITKRNTKNNNNKNNNNNNTNDDQRKIEAEKRREKREIRENELHELRKKRLLEQINSDKIESEHKIRKNSSIINNVKAQPSNFGSAVTLSMLTGGAINPIIVKTLGLDKIVTAGAKFTGRTIGKTVDAGWHMTGGKFLDNLIKPFIDPKSDLRKNLSIGAKGVENISKNWFGLLSKNNKESEAIKKDKQSNDPLVKNSASILDYVKKIYTNSIKNDEKDPKKKSSIFGKLMQAIGGFATILKGAAIAALPLVIKTIFPKMTAWLDKKLKGFMTDNLGFSESTTEGASQLIKDAMPGALAGMTIGGWRGALLGAGLSIGYNYIKRKWDEFQGNAEKETTPKKIGPIPLNYAEAMIAGATIGSLGGFKGAIVGALVGLAGQGLYNLSSKIGEWTANAINWLSEHPISATGISLLGIANIGNAKKAFKATITAMKAVKSGLGSFKEYIIDASSKFGKSAIDLTKRIGSVSFNYVKDKASILANALAKGALDFTNGMKDKILSQFPELSGALGGLAKAVGIVGATLLAADILSMITEKITDKIMSEKAKKEHAKVESKKGVINNLSEEELGQYNDWLHKTGQWEAYAQGYTTEKGLLWDDKKDFDYNQSLEQFRNYQEKFLNKKPEGDVPNFKLLGFENLKQYSDVPWNGTIRRNKTIPSKIANNLNAIHENVISPLQTALGNHKITITSSYRDPEYNYDVGGAKNSRHLTGNAVDLQVNGMTPEQVTNVLEKANIPFSRAIREKSGNTQWLHLEYNPNGKNAGILANMDASTGKYIQVGSNTLKLNTQDMPTTAENQYATMNAMNETTQASAEAEVASSGGILDMLGNIDNSISSGFDSMSNDVSPNDGGIISKGFVGGGTQSLALNIPNTQGGAGSSTGNVYAFGDVAKTPILYTL